MKRKRQNSCCSCCPKKQKKIYKIKTTEELLSLMNIYYSEWQHRDSIMWKQIFTFFFASFIVTLLPFANIWDISLANVIPPLVFPIVGAALACIFLFISIGYARRFSRISDSYRKLIDYLPKDFRREQLHKKEDISWRKRLAYIVPVVMFSALILFSGIILILCLRNNEPFVFCNCSCNCL